MELNDRYSQAGITVEADHYNYRKNALDEIRGSLEFEQVLDLAEYLFELADAPSDGWFAKKLLEHDPTFSTYSKAREIRLLSAQILENEVAERDVLAGLVVLTGEFNGLRVAEDIGTLPSHMETELSKISSSIRNLQFSVQKPPMVLEPDENITAAISAAKAQNAFQQVHSALDAIYTVTLDPHPAHLQHIQAIKELSKSMQYMREESNLLWWHISEWSDIAGGPHTQLKQELAAVLLPFDAAQIVQSAPSPVSLHALFKRALAQRASKSKIAKNATISSVIDSVDITVLEKLPLPSGTMRAPGLFPLIYALKTAKEIGTKGLWRSSFETHTHLDPDTSISPAAVALQLSRELDAQTLVS